MFTKKIFFVAFPLLCLNMSAQATVDCAKDCAKEEACMFTFKKNQCKKDCGFDISLCAPKVQEKASVKTPEETQEEVHKAPSSPPNHTPPLPRKNPAPPPRTRPLPPKPKSLEQQVSPKPTAVAGDALLLERITNKLLTMTNLNCNRLIDQSYSKVNHIPPKPKGYKKPYKSSTDYDPIFKQISQSFKDLKVRVNKLLATAKDPSNKTDLTKIFEDIYGDIDLHSRKNCEKYTNSINAELDTQLNNINIFKKENSSALQRVKSKLKSNK